MATRSFVYKEDPEFGTYGWIPKNYEGGNAADGRLVAHDMLEHFIDDSGGVEGELHALGASVLIRDTSWYATRGSRFSMEENMASSLALDILRAAFCNRDAVRPLKSRAFSDAGLEDSFRWMADEAYRVLRGELDEEERAEALQYLEQANLSRKGLLAHLREGYRRAKRRYAGLCSWELSELFNTIAQKVDRVHADEGDVLTVTVYPKVNRVSVSVKSPYDDYYH